VYVIWRTGNPAPCIYVGSGNIKTRLANHRNDARITDHARNGKLLVTWASVPPESDRLGIERYLADHYQPLVGDTHPNVVPIEVNLVGKAA
jgi:hypothetical protein